MKFREEESACYNGIPVRCFPNRFLVIKTVLPARKPAASVITPTYHNGTEYMFKNYKLRVFIYMASTTSTQWHPSHHLHYITNYIQNYR